jgi:signal peptidase I
MDNKPRKAWIAGLLSILMPGLGQIYNGQALKGLIIIAIPLLLLFPALTIFLIVNNVIIYLSILVILSFSFYIAVFIDSILNAKKYRQEYQLKKFNKVYIYIGIFIISVILHDIISTYVKENYLKAYRITAISMEPVLFKGDHVLADHRSSARNPKCGDIIIFEFPQNHEMDFIKRVVAVGGDIVEVRDKQLYINNIPAKESYIVHSDPFILTTGKGIIRDNFGPVTVPQESYLGE